MFVEIITQSRSDYELVEAATGLQTKGPPGLVAAISWEGETPEEVTMLMVWESPEARGEFAFRHIMPLAERGQVTSSPKRLKPVRMFVRQ